MASAAICVKSAVTGAASQPASPSILKPPMMPPLPPPQTVPNCHCHLQGLKAALQAAASIKGLLEMMFDVISGGWGWGRVLAVMAGRIQEPVAQRER